MKKLRKSFFYLSILTLVGFFLTSCAPKNETKVTLQLEALGAGPFFSGPNSLIAEYTVKLSDMKGLENVSKDQIKEIKMKSASVSLNDKADINFDAFSSASLQIVGPKTAMQTVAIRNPIKSKNKEITLKTSDEVDIVKYFKGDKFSVVLDLNFIEDAMIEEIGTVIELEMIVKHN